MVPQKISVISILQKRVGGLKYRSRHNDILTKKVAPAPGFFPDAGQEPLLQVVVKTHHQ
jgi:hypothetical protein